MPHPRASRTLQSLRQGSFVVAVATVFTACGTVQPLRPLEPGQVVLQSSLVGVFLQEDFVYGAAQPAIGARYGLTPELELRGHLHPATLVSSILSADFGMVWHGPRLNGFQFHGALDAWWLSDPGATTRAIRGLVNARALAHWEASDWVWPFASVDAGLAFDDGDFVPGAGFGVQLPVGAWEISVEARLGAFDEPTDDFSQPYIGVAGRGVLFGGVGIGYRL